MITRVLISKGGRQACLREDVMTEAEIRMMHSEGRGKEHLPRMQAASRNWKRQGTSFSSRL